MGRAETAGFQFDVATSDGTSVATRYVRPYGRQGPRPTDAFFTLPPGDYLATPPR